MSIPRLAAFLNLKMQELQRYLSIGLLCYQLPGGVMAVVSMCASLGMGLYLVWILKGQRSVTRKGRSPIKAFGPTEIYKSTENIFGHVFIY